MGLRDKILNAGSRGEAGLHKTNRIMVYVAALALFGMMMLTVADVVGRYFLNSPVNGAFEIVGFLLVGAGTWGMGYCQIKKGHIRVDFLLQRFGERWRLALTVLANLLGLAAFSLMCWRVILLAGYYLSLTGGRGAGTDTLGTPYFPFVVALAVGTGMLALVLLFDLVRSVAEVLRK